MAGITHWLNPETGLYEIKPESFVNADVPGAGMGVDPATMAEPIAKYNDANAQAAVDTIESNTKANTQMVGTLTDEQKAAKQSQDLVRKAQLQEQKAQLEATKAQNAQEDALGVSPESGLPEGTRVEALPTTPEEWVATGQLLQDQARAEQTGVGRKIEKATSAAEQARATSMANYEKQAAEDLKTSAEAAQKRFADIDTKVEEIVSSDVKRPSPSMLNLMGVFLGGLIAPMNGGRNVALETVERQMDREIALEQENRAKKLQGLRTQKENINDALAEENRDQGAMHLRKAQMFNAVYNEAIAKANNTNLPAKQTADMKLLAGQAWEKRGFHAQELKRLAREDDLKRQKTEADIRLVDARAAAAAGKKGRGGGGDDDGTKMPKAPLGSPGGARPVWSVLDNKMIDPTEWEGLKERKLATGITASTLGITFEAGGMTTDTALLDPSEAKEIKTDIRARNDIRQQSSLVRGAITEIIKRSGDDNIKTPLSLKFSGITGLALDPAKQELLQAISGLTDVAKRESGAGASLTENELKIITNETFGTNPDKFLATHNLGEIRDAVGRYEQQVDLTVRLGAANPLGVSPEDIKFKEADFTAQQRKRFQKPELESTQTMLGNARALTESVDVGIDTFGPNKSKPDGDPYKEAQAVVDQLSKNYLASVVGGTGESGKKKAGGITSKGNEVIEMKKLAASTKDKKLKRIWLDGVAKMDKEKRDALKKANDAKKNLVKRSRIGVTKLTPLF